MANGSDFEKHPDEGTADIACHLCEKEESQFNDLYEAFESAWLKAFPKVEERPSPVVVNSGGEWCRDDAN